MEVSDIFENWMTRMLTVAKTPVTRGRCQFSVCISFNRPKKIGKRHSTIVLSPYLSSMMRCERIKPDIFYINRDMPTGPAVSFCSTQGCLGYVTVVRYTCHCHVGGSSSTYYLLIQRKTRSLPYQRYIIALFVLHDDI